MRAFSTHAAWLAHVWPQQRQQHQQQHQQQATGEAHKQRSAGALSQRRTVLLSLAWGHSGLVGPLPQLKFA